MTDIPSPAPRTRPRVRPAVIAVALMLAVYAGMALAASRQKGPAFDEGEQLAVGDNIWLNQDFRMEGANGDIVKRWATLPYLLSQPKFPGTERRFWREAQPYRLGFLFLFMNGNAPEWLLLQARAMMVVVGVAAGLLVFFCAREIFGVLGGLLALALFISSQNMLAFGALVSTTMPVCFALLGSTWCIWRLLHRVTWGRLAASVAFLSLLFLAKPSGLVILPITAVLVAIKLIEGHPLAWCLGRERQIRSHLAQLGFFCGLIAIHAVVSWSAIWANYDFRYESNPKPDDPNVGEWRLTIQDPISPTTKAFLSWSRRVHFLPEGFLDGIQTLLHQDERRGGFMDGEWTIGGWMSYFPYAIWAKTSPALLGLWLLGLGWWIWRWRRGSWPMFGASSVITHPNFYDIASYLMLIVVYLVVAMSQDVDIGHRHVLPIYPAIYILAGGSAALIWKSGRNWLRGLIAMLLAVSVTESVAMYPDYLGYFSPFVGGPQAGYKRLVDSSLDWGMNLPALKQWLDTNNPGGREPVYLAYFGTDYPEYYGIQSNRLPGYPDWRQLRTFGLGGGIYAISATLYQSLYSTAFGPWNREYEAGYQNHLQEMTQFERSASDPAQRTALIRAKPPGYWNHEYLDFDRLRFARLCAWLRQNRPPDATAGYSILIWRLSDRDIHEALLGPQPEQGPSAWRWKNPLMSTGVSDDIP